MTRSTQNPARLRRLAVIGAGPMGLSLAAITSAHVPTVLVARDPDRAERIRRSGIELGGALEASGRPDVVASIDDLADIHPIDLVFIATKATAIADVCDALRPYLGELPYLVSYQNGIETGRTIIRTLGTARVVRMVLRYGAAIESGEGPGPLRVTVGLQEAPHFVGAEGEAREYAQALAPQIDAMGLPMKFADDIEREAWHKGIQNAATNPVAALVQAPLAELWDSPARRLIERLLDEGIAVARGAEIDVDPAFRADTLRTFAGGSSHLPSMAHDVLAGRPTEITQLNEQIAQRGSELGIPTPTHDAVLDLIRVFDWRLERAAD